MAYKTYQWKTPGLFKGNVQKIGEFLTKMPEVTPERLVEEARNPNSVLHECFEWNDQAAADRYRITQARMLLAQVVFMDPKQEDETPKRLIVSVSAIGESPRYMLRDTVNQNPVLREQYVEKALDQLNSWRHKYAEYAELKEIIEAIDPYILAPASVKQK